MSQRRALLYKTICLFTPVCQVFICSEADHLTHGVVVLSSNMVKDDYFRVMALDDPPYPASD